MTIRITQVLSPQEYVAMNEEALAKGFYREDRHIFKPGMAWFQPWYYDPWSDRVGENVMFKAPPADLDAPGGFLSPHYWCDWAAKRPPVCVVCPNGELWEIDRRSSNGTGWVVTGDLPNITCSPSVVVHGYHGFLRDGCFTADVDGREPNGIPRAYTPRAAA